jgi:ATP synthase mitochondrial F1 complex assembly factor 2
VRGYLGNVGGAQDGGGRACRIGSAAPSAAADGADHEPLRSPPSHVQTSEGFAVTLDGRALNTPARRPLVLPTRALALAIAAEWGWQAGRVRPHTMPLTALAAHAIDEPRGPAAVVDNLVGYLHADSALCVPPPGDGVGGTGRALADAHAAAFGPVTAWAESTFGAPFVPSHSIFGAAQPAAAVSGVRAYLESLDRWELAAAASAAGTCKSVLLGLALVEGAVSVPAALAAARLEEELQAAEWGFVEGGHDLDAASAAVAVSAPSVFVRLARYRRPE